MHQVRHFEEEPGRRSAAKLLSAVIILVSIGLADLHSTLLADDFAPYTEYFRRLTVGRCDYYKGHSYLPQAAPLMCVKACTRTAISSSGDAKAKPRSRNARLRSFWNSQT